MPRFIQIPTATDRVLPSARPLPDATVFTFNAPVVNPCADNVALNGNLSGPQSKRRSYSRHTFSNKTGHLTVTRRHNTQSSEP
jgi:hypothetical protein